MKAVSKFKAHNPLLQQPKSLTAESPTAKTILKTKRSEPANLTEKGKAFEGRPGEYPQKKAGQQQNKGSPEGCPESQERRQLGERASKGRGQSEIKEDGDKSKPQQKVNSHIEMVKITYFYCN